MDSDLAWANGKITIDKADAMLTLQALYKIWQLFTIYHFTTKIRVKSINVSEYNDVYLMFRHDSGLPC